MIVLSLVALPAPLLMKFIIDDVLTTKRLGSLPLIILILFSLQFTGAIFSFLSNYSFNVFSQEILLKIKRELYYRFLLLPLSYFDRTQTGYILSRIGEVEGLGIFFSSILARIIIGFIEFSLCLIAMFYLSSKFTIIVLSIIPIYFVVTKVGSKCIRAASLEACETGAAISRQMQDALSGVEIIKCYGAEERERERIRDHLEKYKDTSIRRNILFSTSSEITTLIGGIAGLIILWLSGLGIVNGTFTLGSFMAFSAYMTRLYGPTQLFANIGLSLQPAKVALRRVMEIIDMQAEDKRTGMDIERINARIDFQNVSFSYDSKQVLYDININIERGDKILITGPNGSGKTTIIKLILNLYTADKGQILIDGTDIRRISVSSLRGRVSIVSQNTFLFNDSIRNNILYSRPNANEAEVEEAIKLSGAEVLIKQHPLGIDTRLGERGARLSGGERQKIAIARAILKESDLIIFDEAAAHLDRDSKERINGLFRHKLHDKMCIIISHDIQNIPEITKTYFINYGKIVGSRLSSGIL